MLPRVFADDVKGGVGLMTIEGVIGPATHDYVERAIHQAQEREVVLIVVRMDTPGGLDISMREIIKIITNADIPIVVYVAPSGARAASAGTYILYASHIAAMAPGTNVGAATPVRVGGINLPSKTKHPQDEAEDVPSDNPDSLGTIEHKAINDAVAYLQGLAQLRDRNQEWAEKAVRSAASLTAEAALEQGVIDIVASDIADLLKQLDSREVVIQGKTITLETTGLVVNEISPDWRNQLLSIITNPNVAYILMLIGIYGLIFEFSNPGAIIPGTTGAICLLLALYAFQLLPVSYAGVALILLGIALMIAEAFEPSFGVLGLGGVVAFVIGSIILMDTDAPGFGIDISVILVFAVSSLLVFVFAVGMALKARRRPVVSGLEELIGAAAVAESDFTGAGRVSVHSESWNALSTEPVHKGEPLVVTAVDGLTLTVKREE